MGIKVIRNIKLNQKNILKGTSVMAKKCRKDDNGYCKMSMWWIFERKKMYRQKEMFCTPSKRLQVLGKR